MNKQTECSLGPSKLLHRCPNYILFRYSDPYREGLKPHLKPATPALVWIPWLSVLNKPKTKTVLGFQGDLALLGGGVCQEV